MTKFKAGQKLTYKPHNAEVEVIHNTLKPAGVNADEAVVFIKTKNGIIMPVPVEVQDEYLTTAPPVKVGVVKKLFGKNA